MKEKIVFLKAKDKLWRVSCNVLIIILIFFDACRAPRYDENTDRFRAALR
ncbi:MAG: hypothetical protein ACRYHA_07830 [Janthinobacterium lividum]